MFKIVSVAPFNTMVERKINETANERPGNFSCYNF